MNDHVLCAAGFNYEPILYDFTVSDCKELKQIDEKKKAAKKTKGGFADIHKRFQNMADKGMHGDEKKKKEKKNTKHVNTISNIRIAGPREAGLRGIGDALKISTSSHDGQIVTWNLLVKKRLTLLSDNPVLLELDKVSKYNILSNV